MKKIIDHGYGEQVFGKHLSASHENFNVFFDINCFPVTSYLDAR